jgi:hypothetical protein
MLDRLDGRAVTQGLSTDDEARVGLEMERMPVRERPGAAEQPPLPERRTEVERALQVAFGLDALGEDVRANDTEYGLGGSVFAADLERARRVPIESTAAWCGSITPGGPGRSLSPTRQPFTGAGELHGAGRLLSPTEQTTRRPGRAGRGGRSPDGALAGPGDR